VFKQLHVFICEFFVYTILHPPATYLFLLSSIMSQSGSVYNAVETCTMKSS
jgi:hypothetical protein